jgi:hypothetical protein
VAELAVGPRTAKLYALLDEIPRLKRLRPLSTPRSTASRLTTIHPSPARTKARKGEIRRIGKSANHAATDLGSKSDKQNQIRLRQHAGGEQCAPVLVKMRPGLMTTNLRSPTLTDDEGKIRRRRDESSQ